MLVTICNLFGNVPKSYQNAIAEQGSAIAEQGSVNAESKCNCRTGQCKCRIEMQLPNRAVQIRIKKHLKLAPKTFCCRNAPFVPNYLKSYK
jgi:hypothetical protein